MKARAWGSCLVLLCESQEWGIGSWLWYYSRSHLTVPKYANFMRISKEDFMWLTGNKIQNTIWHTFTDYGPHLQSMVLEKEIHSLFWLAPILTAKLNSSVKVSFLLTGADQWTKIFIVICKQEPTTSTLARLICLQRPGWEPGGTFLCKPITLLHWNTLSICTEIYSFPSLHIDSFFSPSCHIMKGPSVSSTLSLLITWVRGTCMFGGVSKVFRRNSMEND